ncbi:MAG: hypothetical protein WA324_28535 [Bryobacteraceae bacterium]
MPYQASVINVMIASPGDVAAERSAIQTIIHKWNSVNAEGRRIVLMPIMWQTHSTPRMGESPQAIINRQVLEQCDLLVAVFWTRLGSPTGTAPSGTVEEIRKHVKSGKPAMVYFSNQPVALQSVDTAQLEGLKAFKEDCKNKGLISTYDSLQEFSDVFSNHLTQIVRDQFSEVGALSREASGPLTPEYHQISDTAKQMLVGAAEDRGEILRIPMLGGIMMSAGAQRPENADPRVSARWEAALKELIEVGCIEGLGDKGEIFKVTHFGYQAADILRTYPQTA